MFFNKQNLDTKELNTDISRLFISQEIIKRISNVNDIEEMCKITLDEIENKMGYSSASISIYNEKENTIQLKYISNSTLSKLLKKIVLSKESFEPIKISNKAMTLTMKAVIEKRVIIDNNIASFIVPPLSPSLAAIVERFPNAKSMIALPIKNREGVFGVLNFTLPKLASEISQNEMRTLELFIDQIGLIIDNSIKYSEISNFNITLKDEIDKATSDLKQQNHDLSSLYTLTSNVSKSLDPTVVSQTAVDSLPQDLAMIGSVIAIHDESTNELFIQSLTNNQLSEGAKKIIGDFSQYRVKLNDPEFENNISGKAFRYGKVYATTDLADFISPPVPKQFVAPLSKLLNIRSLVSFPITSRGKTIGVITYLLKAKTFEELTESEQQLFATYTYQIAIALDNAALLRNLETAKNQIEEAYKKEKDMMDILGHELRTPLTIARNAILMIDMEYKKPEPNMVSVKDLLEKSKENIRREVSTLQTVLSSTRLENDRAQINYEKIDAKDVVNDSVEAMTRDAVKKALEIKVDMPQEDVFVWAGREQIQEIMDNLLSNAVKYTTKGLVTLTLSHDDKFVNFEVKDTGEGIPENEIKNLGKKFHRVNPYVQSSTHSELKVVRPGGTGIGLYVVKGFLKLMNGNLLIQSKLGEGSTFTAVLPIYNGQDKANI